MILKNSTMNEFIKIIAGKRLYCFGAGSLSQEMCNESPSLISNELIYRFIDNNKKLHRTKKVIGSIKIPIISVEDFLNEADENTIILFTMFHSYEAFIELDKINKLERTPCYLYRMIKGANFDHELMEQKLPSNGLKNSGKEKIPKKIHYCWFGKNELPDFAKRCIESWEKYCPNYEIIRWDETNYDVTKNEYMYQAYKDKKWAFVSDYARVDIIYNYGGIYLDTDVEIIKSFGPLLYEKAFCGFESMNYVAFGLGFGSEKGNSIIKEILDLYNDLKWDGGKIACPIYQTRILKENGLIDKNSFQRLKDITVLPAECLSGKSIATRQINITSNTFSIHHFAASWYEHTKEEKEFLKLWERLEQDEKL